MQIPTYFFKSLESIYYFRMRVPTDLRSIFNRAELKKSLRTKSKTVALRRCRQYVAAAEQLFETLRLSHFKSELTGTSPTVQAVDLEKALNRNIPTITSGTAKESFGTRYSKLLIRLPTTMIHFPREVARQNPCPPYPRIRQ